VSLATGLSARTPLALDVAQGLLGLCCAAVVPPAAGILGAAYATPSRRKNVVFACLSSGNPLGFVAGSLVSGIAVRVGGNWRAAYVVLAIIAAAWAAVGVWAVPSESAVAGENPARASSVVESGSRHGIGGDRKRWNLPARAWRAVRRWEVRKAAAVLKRFDAVGTVLTILGTGLFTASLT
jgi:MFS family permease